MNRETNSSEQNESTIDQDGSASYILDRFEDNGWAVLEDEDGISFNVPRFWLPDDLAEGDVVVVEQQELLSEDEAYFTTGYRSLDIYTDKEATQARQDRAKELRDSLSKGPQGDLSL